MKKRIISAILLTLVAIFAFIPAISLTAEAADSGTYTLVKDASSLKSGDKIIIVANDSDYALSTTQNKNNRGQAAVTKSDDSITFGDDVQIITLEEGNVSGTFAFNVGDGYLYAASSSSNYLRTETTLSDNSSWSITVGADGVATITAQGTNTRNTIYYNKSSGLFSAYSSAQQSVCIYKLDTSVSACTHTNTTTTTVDATCTTEGSVTVTCDDCEEIISVTVLPELGHSYNAEGVCTVCNDTIPVASFSVPSGATAIDDVLGTLVTMPDAPVLPNIDYNREYTFVGWATAEQDNVSVKPTVYAPGDSVEINTDTAFFAVYSYSEVTTTTTSGWLKKDISEIKSGDIIAITMSKNGTTWVLNSANGTSSAPSANSTTIGSDFEPADNCKWVVEVTNDGYVFYVYGSNNTKWLYSTDSNNGIRVGTSAAKTFVVDSGYLKNIETSSHRYMGVYNNQDWRTYTSIHANIAGQTLAFYVLSNESVETEVSYFTTSLDFASGFTGASLNVAADLSLRYHALLENGGDGYTVRFTMDGKEVVVNGVADGGKFVFSFCGIAPQCMGDTIKAELLYNGEVIDVIEEYSVKQYVISALALHSTDTELCRLLSNMLYYGAAAQKYVSYKTDALVTDGVAGILSALDTVPDDSNNNRSLVTEDGADTSVEFIAAGVRFDYNNRIYVKLTTADITNVTVTVGGAELEIISLGNNTYIAYSDGISALDFDVEISFELRRGGTLIQTLTYTVNTYAWDKQDNDKIGELALALYRYGESAKEYAN